MEREIRVIQRGKQRVGKWKFRRQKVRKQKVLGVLMTWNRAQEGSHSNSKQGQPIIIPRESIHRP